MITPSGANPEQPDHPKYATHRPTARFFREALEHLGATSVDSSREDCTTWFWVSFVSSRELAERIAEAGTFDVLVKPQGRYELGLSTFGLSFRLMNSRAPAQEELTEVLRRLCATWKNRFGLRTHLCSRELEEELRGAATQNDFETVESVLQLGRQGTANAALALGAELGQQRVIDLALKFGAEVDGGEGTPLENACRAHHWPILKFLLEQGANPLRPRQSTTVFELCWHPEALMIMLDSLRGLPAGLALRLAKHAIRSHCDEPTVVAWLATRLRARPGWYTLATKVGLATACGDEAKVKELLREDGSNENAKEALDAATAHGHSGLVAHLLPGCADQLDDAMVARAAARGDLEVLKLLVKYPFGPVTVQVAISAGQNEALELILATHRVHVDKELALRFAVDCNRPDAIKLLLQNGADWRRLEGHFGGGKVRVAFEEHAATSSDGAADRDIVLRLVHSNRNVRNCQLFKEYGRQGFTVPGRIKSPRNKGCRRSRLLDDTIATAFTELRP
jgi:hypothetical protein